MTVPFKLILKSSFVLQFKKNVSRTVIINKFIFAHEMSNSYENNGLLSHHDYSKLN